MTTREQTIEVMARAIYEKRNGQGCLSWSTRERNHKLAYVLDAQVALSVLEALGWTPPQEKT